jgi:SulP family sulfate permease
MRPRNATSARFSARDVLGGLSVALIVIPQGLAYAEIAGMPPVTGLYAAALPALAAAPFASSRYLQTGPTAMTALLSFGAVTALATPGTTEYISLSLLLALLVGVARLGLGLLSGGTVTNYMSPPVVLGFSTAAAVLIISSQLPTALGLTGAPQGLLARAPDALARVDEWNGAALALALFVGAVVWGARRISPLIPGILIVVIVGLIVGAQSSYGAELVGAVPEGFPPLGLEFPWSRLPDLLVPGLVIALIGFAEPTAIARTMAARDRERWDPSRELLSQGFANLVSAFSGGFTVGGSFSRSAISRLAGARTKWAGAVTGAAVLAFMPFAGVLSSLPKAVLASIVITAVVPLARVPDLVRLLRISWGQSAIALITVVATMAFAPRVDLGVVVGVLAAASVHIYREGSRTRVDASYENGTLELSPGGVLFYGSAGALENALSEQLVANPECERLVLALDRLGRIDYSGVMMIRQFTEDATAAGLEVSVINIPAHAAGVFARTERRRPS